MSIDLVIAEDELADVCRRYKVRRLSLFGSAIREDFRADSDVDVLVEFEPDARIGWEFIELQDELSDLIGREVDLHTLNTLSRHFRDKVLQQASVLYERP